MTGLGALSDPRGDEPAGRGRTPVRARRRESFRPDARTDGAEPAPSARGAQGRAAVPWRTRSALARSLDRSLLLLSVGGVALGAIFLALVLPGTEFAGVYLLAAVVFFTFLCAGVIAWRRRPSNGMGALIVFGGFAAYLGMLADTGVPALMAISEMCATLVLAVIIHLLHAFPSGRLQGRFSQVTVLAGYGVCVVLQAPLYLFDGANPVPQLVIADRPDLVAVAAPVQQAAGLLVTVATVVLLVSRLRSSDAAHRRVLIPLFGYGIFAVLFGPFGKDVLAAVTTLPPIGEVILQLLTTAGVPVAFALSVLRGGFARTGELEELGVWLGGAGPEHPPLHAALAHTLGDASLRMLFWVPDRGVFVDADGNESTPVMRGGGRAAVDIERGGRLLGAIEYDADLIPDPAAVVTAGRVVTIAVERDRLTAELRASENELRRSRSRLVESAEIERRRIARDLHDGLQVQLVLLAMRAGELARSGEGAGISRRDATALREGIDAAAAELRRLVHAVMPSTLIEHGLAAAVDDLADRMPLRTTVDLRLGPARLAQTIESAAYFVVSEALANALKHARATACTVQLCMDGEVLRVEVGDDGVGGAVLAPGGLQDRVEALGGVLAVHSPVGGGTLVRVELPCAW